MHGLQIRAIGGQHKNQNSFARGKRSWSDLALEMATDEAARADEIQDIVDDFTVDKKGNIKKVRETSSNNDTLIALDSNGNESGNKIEITSGVLDGMVSKKDLQGTDYEYFQVNNNDEAKTIFEFLSKNSIVEWAQIEFDESSNYIGTSHSYTSNAAGPGILMTFLSNGDFGRIKREIHSHPFFGVDITTTGPSPADKNSAWSIEHHNVRTNSSVISRIYEVKLNQYLNYDCHGIKK